MIFEARAGGQSFRLEVRAEKGAYSVEIDGRKVRVEVGEAGPLLAVSIEGVTREVGISRRGHAFDVSLPEELIPVELRDLTRAAAPGNLHPTASPARVTAPMPGKVSRVLVTPGQAVAAGAGLLVIEAMKMENELRAPRAGVVLELPAREGQAVESGTLLVVVG